MVRDMVAWYAEIPALGGNAGSTARRSIAKNPHYQQASNGGIDCKINGAYVLMGLLFGKRDLDQTILISCRCGMDSDCNPSSSGRRAVHDDRFRETAGPIQYRPGRRQGV